MFGYKRKTGFIDYYINGIKSRSIGIVKQKLEDDRLLIFIEITDLKEQPDCLCKVSIGDGQKNEKIAELSVCKGRGQGVAEISQKEWKAKLFEKIVFSFGNNCYGFADVLELPECKKDEVVCVEEVFEEDAVVNTETVFEEDAGIDTEEESEIENTEECLEPQPDKWEVIKKKYPILYPFKGQGAYVSIKPVDLQLLHPKYHDLNKNSYLMHGFYQYRHMILGEYTQEKGTFFYVGVPGEFIKKEQTSAAMFGFEGYEHSGDLGYYLYRVEL